MGDYAREMPSRRKASLREERDGRLREGDALEKKGVLAKIRLNAELRASVFEAIGEEDQAPENEDNIPPALLGSCNDWAKQLHTSPSGRLLTALVSEYLERAQLGHTLKVYLPECNLPKDFWKEELSDFNTRINKNGESGPLLLDVLEGYLKYKVL
ncbi:hypothetical protein ZIOFF_027811 [Zingiber officinale]|uniref:LisH domain-containing protein n=1 Tax=Zingiber officinale TaxID=94328 RepID=A0A8J5L8K9_ZINOF|nr:hypothetical protein ZIOFF_027811 [Zingiber officinale]